MVVVETFPLGDYQTNCYLVRQAGQTQCVLIDPGYAADFLLDTLNAKELELSAIALTHGHFDHVGAVRDLAAETGCRVYLSGDELSLPPAITAGRLYYTDLYTDRFTAAGIPFTVLKTPGHTPGSVCLRTGSLLFSGDTLFAGSCGRTDLPGGNPADMRASLKLLAAIPENLTVYPGHGEATTLDAEKRYNPYL
jgi:hydroxyacylglutathione hydrolase